LLAVARLSVGSLLIGRRLTPLLLLLKLRRLTPLRLLSETLLRWTSRELLAEPGLLSETLLRRTSRELLAESRLLAKTLRRNVLLRRLAPSRWLIRLLRLVPLLLLKLRWPLLEVERQSAIPAYSLAGPLRSPASRAVKHLLHINPYLIISYP
jgi:hypothetical protein